MADKRTSRTYLAFHEIENSSMDDLLHKYAKNIYTVLRTMGRNRFLKYELHESRIVDGTRAMYGERYSVDDIKVLLARSISHAVNSFLSSSPIEDGEDLRILVIVRPDDEWRLAFLCHVDVIPNVLNEGPIVVANFPLGVSRENPHIKSSTWVVERSKYQQDGVWEHLICTEDGGILEGGSSNFFVVLKDGRTIQTAPDGGILSGTIRECLISLLKNSPRFKLLLKTPKISEIDTWDSAFITSTTRILFSVGEFWEMDGRRLVKKHRLNGWSEVITDLRSQLISYLRTLSHPLPEFQKE